jgi:hypothetical protein
VHIRIPHPKQISKHVVVVPLARILNSPRSPEGPKIGWGCPGGLLGVPSTQITPQMAPTAAPQTAPQTAAQTAPRQPQDSPLNPHLLKHHLSCLQCRRRRPCRLSWVAERKRERETPGGSNPDPAISYQTLPDPSRPNPDPAHTLPDRSESPQTVPKVEIRSGRLWQPLSTMATLTCF